MGTLLLRSFAHPMELAAVAIFSPSLHSSSPSPHPFLSRSLFRFNTTILPALVHPIRRTDARARPSFFVSLTLCLPSPGGWQFLRHDYPRNLSSANARTVFPAVRPMLRLPSGRTSTYTRGYSARERWRAFTSATRCGGRGSGLKIGGWTARRYNAGNCEKYLSKSTGGG